MNEQEMKEQYNQMLDETNEEVVIGSLRYSPSYVLESVDPIAYEIGFQEWADLVNEDAEMYT
jgi:hypothetical protein